MDSMGRPYNGYDDLENQILAKMKAGVTKDLVLVALKNGFGTALAGETAIIDRSKRKMLFTRTARTLLEELVSELENDID